MRVKRAKSNYVLMVGVMALLAAGSFLLYSLYSVMTKSQITSEQRVEIKPLNGNLNQKVMDNLLLRRQFSSETLAGVKSLDYSLTKENLSAKKLATDSGIVEIATSSGGLVP
jgi:hypothetical protein